MKVHEFNDGLDGIVVAKSLKHALKMLQPFYKFNVNYIYREIKRCIKNDLDSDFMLTDCYKIKRCKSKIIGWRE